MENDIFLIVWTIELLIFELVILGATAYIVFGLGYSGWWFALAIIFCIQPTYFKVIKKRYNLE